MGGLLGARNQLQRSSILAKSFVIPTNTAVVLIPSVKTHFPNVIDVSSFSSLESFLPTAL